MVRARWFPGFPMPGSPAEPNAWFRATLGALLERLAAGELTPVVAERIPLVDAVRAHQPLARGGHAGKTVLVAGT